MLRFVHLVIQIDMDGVFLDTKCILKYSCRYPVNVHYTRVLPPASLAGCPTESYKRPWILYKRCLRFVSALANKLG